MKVKKKANIEEITLSKPPIKLEGLMCSGVVHTDPPSNPHHHLLVYA